MTLALISVGLADEKDLTIRAIEEARSCDELYAETYTTILDTDVGHLGEVIGRPVSPLSRGDLEESSDVLLDEAEAKKVGVLIGGDCLSATTHIGLLLEARKRGIRTRVVHGSSILTAVAETGLSLYKFGRAVTLPLPDKGPVDTVIFAIEENGESGLHTLVLLDFDAETGKHLTVAQGLSLIVEEDRPETFGPESLAVGIARVGWDDGVIRAGRAADLMKQEFGAPPHALVVPGRLHFLEAEALRTLHRCPKEAIDGHRRKGELERLNEKYMTSCHKALEGLVTAPLPRKIALDEVKALIEHAERYLKDAEYYTKERRATALVSLGYVEGILDALRFLGLVKFEW
jgi:diphthine synthase